MSGLLKVGLLLAAIVLCCATPEKKSKKDAKLHAKSPEGNDDDAKVEVVEEEKAEKVKHHKKVKDDEDHDDDDDDDEDGDDDEEEEEEEDEDPNAQISTEELYMPKVCGNKTRSGDLVVLHYTGWLDDGENDVFDTTIDPRKGYVPFEFVLGTGTVIKGFERGVAGMCKGQKRKIVIPPALAYGRKGTHDVPGNSTLTYEVEMLDIRDPPHHTDTFSHIDSNGDKQLTRAEVAAYMKAQAKAQYAPVHDKRWKKQHKRHVESIFDHEDTDEDGVISHEEFSGPKLEYHDEF